ncbi:MAG TPA: YtxH domain-containing protein [Chryseolinea sp.]|nr:YtxH domain-containing protein [Chryseolinea sp.]
MKDSKKLIGGLMAGAALGIAVGLLLAPRSGEKTRKKLLDTSFKLKDDVMASVEGSIEALRKQVNQKIDRLAGGSKDVVNSLAEKSKV